MSCWIQWMQENAIVVQALATVLLVGVTIFYAIRTHSIAKANEKNAEAARELAKSTEDMKIAGVRPLVVLKNRVDQPGTPSKTSCLSLINIGLGPALDVVYDIQPIRENDTIKERVEKAMKENKGHVIGIAPDNIVDLLRGNSIRLVNINFTIEYSDIYGNIYRTTYRDGETNVKQIPKRTLRKFQEVL